MKKLVILWTAVLCMLPLLAACKNDAVQSSVMEVEHTEASAPSETVPEPDPVQTEAPAPQSTPATGPGEAAQPAPVSQPEPAAAKMTVQIGARTFTATLEENEAARELAELLAEGPVTIRMEDYSGFEKVGALGRSLTASDSQTTTAPGDIVLYNGSNIVLFYGSNSWSYTRLGQIDDLTDWAEALSGDSVTATFSLSP